MLRGVSGFGPTGGGNPVFRCADCANGGAAMGCQQFCWCGFQMRGNPHLTAYVCVPFSILKERPELKTAFHACGCDPDRGGYEIGIMLARDLHQSSDSGRAK